MKKSKAESKKLKPKKGEILRKHLQAKKEGKAEVVKTTPMELANLDWYKAMIEEISAIAVESVFEAQSTLLKGKFDIGKLLNEKASKDYPITELVKYASQSLKISERELWYCVKFNSEYKNLQKLPDFQSKALSWNKVKKLLADPEKAKKPCKHEHTITIKICEDCGSRVDDTKKLVEKKV